MVGGAAHGCLTSGGESERDSCADSCRVDYSCTQRRSVGCRTLKLELFSYLKLRRLTKGGVGEELIYAQGQAARLQLNSSLKRVSAGAFPRARVFAI